MIRLAKLNQLASLFILFFIVFPFLVSGQIQNATLLTTHPRLYERMDFSIMLTAQWTNSPYRAEEVRLDLDLVSPSGSAVVIPGYYDKGKSGSLTTWKVRFTPVETGRYTGDFVLTNGNRNDVSSNLSFTVAPSGRKGFLHVANAWSFRFDNGEPFRGIGENIG